MTFDSSTETVAVLYDIENAPFEMLDFTLGKARKFFPCRMIVVSDWEKHPEQKRWNRLMSRKGLTFRQIDRKVDGKNSLDYALFDMAKILRDEGVRRFLIVTTDSDFVAIAQMLRESDTPCHIIGVGTEQASLALRDAFDEFSLSLWDTATERLHRADMPKYTDNVIEDFAHLDFILFTDNLPF